jgi:hypothetical protein
LPLRDWNLGNRRDGKIWSMDVRSFGCVDDWKSEMIGNQICIGIGMGLKIRKLKILGNFEF